MTVLVDDAAWPWRGDRWAHLASDTSVDELHVFANTLGLRRLAFQDDHYDVPASVRELAIANGARAVSSRVLVGALRAAGLRVRGRRLPWREGSRHDAALGPVLGRLHQMWPAARGVAWTTVMWRDAAEGPVAVALSATVARDDALVTRPLPPDVAGVAFAVARPDGVIVDVVLPLPLPPWAISLT